MRFCFNSFWNLNSVVQVFVPEALLLLATPWIWSFLWGNLECSQFWIGRLSQLVRMFIIFCYKTLGIKKKKKSCILKPRKSCFLYIFSKFAWKKKNISFFISFYFSCILTYTAKTSQLHFHHSAIEVSLATPVILLEILFVVCLLKATLNAYCSDQK